MKKTKKTGPKKKKLLLTKEKVRDLSSKDADAAAGGNLCTNSTNGVYSAYNCCTISQVTSGTAGSGSFSRSL